MACRKHPAIKSLGSQHEQLSHIWKDEGLGHTIDTKRYEKCKTHSQWASILFSCPEIAIHLVLFPKKKRSAARQSSCRTSLQSWHVPYKYIVLSCMSPPPKGNTKK